MKSVPLPIRNAIQKGRRIAVLVEIDHPNGQVNVWSRVGNLQYNGLTWTGIGTLGRITGIGGSKTLQVVQVTFELRGVPPDTVTFLESNVRGRQAQAWLAALQPHADAIDGDLYPIVSGLCDSQQLAITDQLGATVQLIVNEPIFIVDRAQNLAWTSEQLAAEWGPGLTGLDDIPELVNKNVSWTPT